MSVQSDSTLKGHFETGDTPTETQFANLIDSKARVDGQTFSGAVVIDKASNAAFVVEDSGTTDNVLVVDTVNGRVEMASTVKIDTASATALVVEDDGVTDDVLVVDTNDGQIGINRATPLITLDCWDDVASYVARFSNDGNNANRNVIILRGGEDTNPTHTAASIRDGNATEIGSIAGDGNGGTNYNTTSDERIKQDVEPLQGALDVVLAIEPKKYRGKGVPPERAKVAGFVAQQVRGHAPDVVTEQDDGVLGMDYGRISTYNAGAIQEMYAEFDARLKALEARVTALESA